jgi:hypothetical protein
MRGCIRTISLKNELNTGFKNFDYRDCRFYTRHLFFAITKIQIGYALGHPFLDSFGIIVCILRPGKMISPLTRLPFFRAAIPLEKVHGVQCNGIPKWNYAPRASVCSESRLYDKLPLG